jgi:hypothetical protein
MLFFLFFHSSTHTNKKIKTKKNKRPQKPQIKTKKKRKKEKKTMKLERPQTIVHKIKYKKEIKIEERKPKRE